MMLQDLTLRETPRRTSDIKGRSVSAAMTGRFRQARRQLIHRETSY